jgi:glycosyltransferase involved in cell wall biosynthesis
MASANTSMPADAAHDWIALLGRRDEPTDGVEDYCTVLAKALAPQAGNLRQVRVQWDKQGWLSALGRLRHASASWRNRTVILQYTAMAWSRRGFPFGALAALAILRRSGVRCVVMFHEPFRQTVGRRLVDRLRGVCQDYVVRRLYAGADAAIFADPLTNIPWLPQPHAKAFFIPIGANIPVPSNLSSPSSAGGNTRTVCVFCFSDPPNRDPEVDDIAHAVRAAAPHGLKLRLILIGRGTAEAKKRIEPALADTPVEVIVLGIRPADEVARILADSDAMLCVRGSLYPRRGSALAGIACGLPIIGYAGAAHGTLLEEAGIELVPKGDREALGRALTRVLQDEALRTELRNRSMRAQERFFSWERIARQYIDALDLGDNGSQVANRPAERS